MANQSMDHLCETLENYFFLSHPIEDRTGLPGFYDITLNWNWKGGTAKAGGPLMEENFKSCCEAIYDQLGLEIIPTNAQLEMLVVQKVQ